MAIYNDQPYHWPYESAGLLAIDPFVDIIGLQIKSLHGAAFFGYNQITIRRSILEGGSNDEWTSHAAVWLDAGPCVVANSLIISHGPAGVIFKYPGIVLHSTIVNLDHTSNSVGIETGNKWVYDDTTVADTAIFGFSHAGSTTNAETAYSPKSSNNVTDAPIGDSGTTQWMGAPEITRSGSFLAQSTAPRWLLHLSIQAATGEQRMAARLLARESAFGPFNTFCNQPQGPRCANYAIYNFDSPDLIGTPRPQGGSYDIGALQSCSPSACQRGSRLARPQ